MKILVIEDSERLLRSLGSGLKKMGHRVDLVADGNEGWDYARLNTYDVIILDIMIPGMDGFTLLEKLRNAGKQTNVLILSARDQVEDRIRGLQLGADDYMIKPFSFDELTARLTTLMRRAHDVRSPMLELGGVILDTSKREVTRNGQAVKLTPGEYAVFECLALNRSKVLSKEQLLDAVHNSDSYAGTNVIEVMVCNLRKKLGGELIRTVRGVGYVIGKA